MRQGRGETVDALRRDPLDTRWQLDVCGFTALSQTRSPREVATLMHALFCRFDAEVAQQMLFKVLFYQLFTLYVFTPH